MRATATVVVILLSLMFLACSGGAKLDENEAVAAARTAAENWLELVDNRNDTESWEATAAKFKEAGEAGQWQASLENARKIYGKLVSRQLREALYKTKLPGSSRGHFVVIQYDSVFENRAKVLETVTPMLEKDGHWRVAGYIVK